MMIRDRNFPSLPEWDIWAEAWKDGYALTSDLPVSGSSPWIGTALAAGTFAQPDGAFGVATLSGAATTDNSGLQLQTDREFVALRQGKVCEFVGNFKLSDATESELLFAIAVRDTTLLDGTGTLAAGLTHSDGIGFYKPDGENNIYGYIRRDNVQANTGALASIADNTWTVLAVRIEMDPSVAGKGYVTFYKDGNVLGGGANLTSTTMPYEAEEDLAVSIAFLSGNNSGTKVCSVRSLIVAQER